jgi:hypothetical protein
MEKMSAVEVRVVFGDGSATTLTAPGVQVPGASGASGDLAAPIDGGAAPAVTPGQSEATGAFGVSGTAGLAAPAARGGAVDAGPAPEVNPAPDRAAGEASGAGSGAKGGL